MPDGAAVARTVVLLVGASVLFGCSGGRHIASGSEENAEQAESMPTAANDAEATEQVPAPLFPRSYRVYPRSARPESIPVSGYDLDHTQLDIGFNFSDRSVHGTVIHDLRVTTDSLTSIPFHAFGISVQTAHVSIGDTDYETTWSQSGQILSVATPVTLMQNDSVEVELTYSAWPHRTAVKKGLYFVDPDGIDASLPTQIWTLGQPEDNRIWLPTWDYPNDRMTFDVSITVPDSLATFASGVLVETSAGPDHTRRDRWELDTPQPAYLLALAVGDFVAMTDRYVSPVGKVVPVSYFGEPEYADLLDVIYGITPEVLEVIERKTAVAYPFSILKQIAVREFTAGGMENSTAIIYDAHLQHDRRAHLDYTGRDLIAHEVAHQWFGDLVTCRSWAHLALNEGFADFIEQVFLEETLGEEDAQEHRISDLEEYLEEASRFRRPIIWTEYSDPNELFDSHAYEKAELVLNALRFELGEVAFWRGIRLYISSSQDGNVQIADLKEAMERSARRPLTRFFEQWFMEPGHPELVVDHHYDDVFGLYEIRVRQMQDPAVFPVYALEAIAELNYEDGGVYKERVRITSADTTYRFGIAGRISFVRFDEGEQLLADIVERKPADQWMRQAVDDDEMAGRYDAIGMLAGSEPSAEIARVLLDVAQNDPYDLVRTKALDALASYRSLPEVVLLARESALEDESPRCRRAAVRLLGETGDPSALAVLRRTLQDSSYYVVAESMRAYARLLPTDYVDALQHVSRIRSWEGVVERAVLEVVLANPVPEAEDYVLQMLRPENPEQLRMHAIRTLAAFSGISDAWKTRVKTLLRNLQRDVNAAIRTEAGDLLKQL